MSLRTNAAVAYHGASYELPVILAGVSFPRLDPVLSVVAGMNETQAGPITVASTNPTMAGAFSGGVDGASFQSVQQARWNAKMCVTWTRGQASFYAEADLGCSFVVLATTANIAIATKRSGDPGLRTQVSATLGAHPRPGALAGPVWTSGPHATAANGTFIMVPPFARAVRVGSLSQSACQVWNWKAVQSVSESAQTLASPPALIVTSFSEVHPISTDANYIQVMSAATWANGGGDTIVAKFLLDL